jgi:hypothetical protein
MKKMTKKELVEKFAIELYENREDVNYYHEEIELLEKEELTEKVEKALKRKNKLLICATERCRHTKRMAEMIGLNIQKVDERAWEILVEKTRKNMAV